MANLPLQVDPPRAECDEERPDDVADEAAAVHGGDDEHREADEHHRRREHDDRARVRPAHAVTFPVATITRTGACFRTKSTVSPKIARRPAASLTRRGPPMTMISEPRRMASSTIARPEFRARMMRVTTLTP